MCIFFFQSKKKVEFRFRNYCHLLFRKFVFLNNSPAVQRLRFCFQSSWTSCCPFGSETYVRLRPTAQSYRSQMCLVFCVCLLVSLCQKQMFLGFFPVSLRSRFMSWFVNALLWKNYGVNEAGWEKNMNKKKQRHKFERKMHCVNWINTCKMEVEVMWFNSRGCCRTGS